MCAFTGAQLIAEGSMVIGTAVGTATGTAGGSRCDTAISGAATALELATSETTGAQSG